MICEIPVHSLITVLIHNSGRFGPPLPFWAPGPRHCRDYRWLVTPLLTQCDTLATDIDNTCDDRRSLDNDREQPIITSNVHLCVQQNARETARRAGPSAIVDTLYINHQTKISRTFTDRPGRVSRPTNHGSGRVGSGHALKGQTRFRLCFVA